MPNTKTFLLLLDIGNTHTHLGLADHTRVLRQANIPTAAWFGPDPVRLLGRFVRRAALGGAALCSVVPRATPEAAAAARLISDSHPLQLNHKTIRAIGPAAQITIDYPKPATIGPDRLANAIAARHFYGAPALVVDFGTAVTFDVVDASGNYVGGIIAPGLSAMTDYLHEKTALLPRIKIAEVHRAIGKNTAEAMRIGAVHGYRGLIRELIHQIERELRTTQLPVVATGGYATLIASRLPEITAVNPLLTLEGLRLAWLANNALTRTA
jgi:type III pantothenate kinase